MGLRISNAAVDLSVSPDALRDGLPGCIIVNREDFVVTARARGWIVKACRDNSPRRVAGGDTKNVDGLFLTKDTDGKAGWFASFADVEAAPDWRALMAGRDVYHMTRVVGYYSRIDNWNLGKLGELADRHRGDYRVGGAEAVPTALRFGESAPACLLAQTSQQMIEEANG